MRNKYWKSYYVKTDVVRHSTHTRSLWMNEFSEDSIFHTLILGQLVFRRDEIILRPSRENTIEILVSDNVARNCLSTRGLFIISILKSPAGGWKSWTTNNHWIFKKKINTSDFRRLVRVRVKECCTAADIDAFFYYTKCMSGFYMWIASSIYISAKSRHQFCPPIWCRVHDAAFVTRKKNQLKRIHYTYTCPRVTRCVMCLFGRSQPQRNVESILRMNPSPWRAMPVKHYAYGKAKNVANVHKDWSISPHFINVTNKLWFQKKLHDAKCHCNF